MAATALAAMTLMTGTTAEAAVVTNVAGSLTYVASPGEANRLVLERAGDDVLVSDPGAGVLFGLPGCPTVDDDTIRCEGVVDAEVGLGDGADTLAVTGALRVSADGGAGDDVLAGGAEADELDGGDGDDAADYSARVAGVVVTLDGVQNDGTPGEEDLVVGVELVLGGSGDDVIDGDDGPNELDGGPGDDSLNGSGGEDEIEGGDGQDGVNALDPPGSGADGGGDRVQCGAGRDRVYGDDPDGVGADCEKVERGAVAGIASDSRVSPAAPPAVLGESVIVEPVSGAVLVTPPEPGSGPRERQEVPAGPAILLDRETNVPVGSVVDTRFGTVEMTAAVDRNGATESGRFHSGPFQVFQDPVVGAVTDLELRGGKRFRACPAGQRGRGVRPRKARSAARRRTVRRLWASTKGRFQTKGRYAAATVRGTRWLTVDRCDGTLVVVREGAVAVTDLAGGGTRVVRAGQSYLVRKS